MEWCQAGRVAGVNRQDIPGSFDAECELIARPRIEYSLFISQFDVNIINVPLSETFLKGHLDLARGSGCLDCLRGDFFSVFPTDRLNLSGLVNYIVPAETILFVSPFESSLGLTVDEELELVAVGIDMDRGHLSLASFPVPMREHMKHGLVGPTCLVEPIAVFRESREVDYSEIGTS